MFVAIACNLFCGLSKDLSQWSYIGVITSPGITALTLTPKAARSTAHSRVNEVIPPFEAAYPEVQPCPVKETFEPIFTIVPLFF